MIADFFFGVNFVGVMMFPRGGRGLEVVGKNSRFECRSSEVLAEGIGGWLFTSQIKSALGLSLLKFFQEPGVFPTEY